MIASKIPSDILKFDGKLGEYPSTHIMAYHLWCSSNSLMDDSVRLHIFQRSPNKATAKWNIELKGSYFISFNELTISFLTHYQFPIQYETRIDLLTSLLQNNSTHICDHIHEWRKRHGMIETQITDNVLMEWFTNSLLPPISYDVAMAGVTIEEKDILRVQHLDLIYSQLGALYDIITNSHHPSTDPHQPHLGPHVDGVVNSISNAPINQLVNQLVHLSIQSQPSAVGTSS